jgi:uncharacterized MAPEG superfamily protein
MDLTVQFWLARDELSGAQRKGGSAVELISVIFAAMAVWLAVMVQHFTNVMLRGVTYVTGDRSIAPPMDGFFGRATRTLSNNLESAIMYIPPTMLIILTQKTSAITYWTAIVYIGVRAVFNISYWLKIPQIRSLSWFTGMVCSAIMAVLAVQGLAGIDR